jgi:predicted nucleic acid-binding protein
VIVVDASIAVKWVVYEADSAQARALSSQTISAPDIWIAEAGNALWRFAKLGQLTEAEVVARIGHLQTADVISVPMVQDAADALQIAIAIDHPTYDCFYLALAIRERTYVVTADTRFAKAVRKHKQWSANLKLLSEI